MIVYKLCVEKDGKLKSLTCSHLLGEHELPKRFIRTYEVGKWTQAPRTLARKKVAPLFCFSTLEQAKSAYIFPSVRCKILKCVARGILRKCNRITDSMYDICRFWDDPNACLTGPLIPGTVLAESVFTLEVLGERGYL